MRMYKSGSRWAFWRWTQTDSDYLTRLHLIMTPWFAICLHWLNKPDPEPYLHDHPVSFLSLILRGGYEEYRSYGGTPRSDMPGSPFDLYNRKWFNRMKATPDHRHRIATVKPRTLTLCLMSGKKREWGYHLHNEQWMHWKTYNDLKRRGIQP